MSIQQFVKLILNKKQTLFSLLVVCLSIAIIFSAVQPFKYGSSLNLLTVISMKDTTDPYVASRSNEYLSSLLARVTSSSSFFDQVMSSNFNIDKNYFSGTDKQKMKKWTKTVEAKSIADSGIIAINVYHTDRAQAEEIAKAVAYTLETNNAQYHGLGDTVAIKEIDKPITSTFPVKPNVLINLSLAISFAILLFLGYIYLFPEEKYDIRFWPKKKIKDDVVLEDEYVEESNQDNFNQDIKEYVQEKIKESGAEQYIENYRQNFENNGNIDNILKK